MASWWRSPSSARAPTSTAWPRSWAPRWPPTAAPRRCTHELPRSDALSGRQAGPARERRWSPMSDTRTIFEISKPGRRAFVAPELDVPPAQLPERFRRREPPELPEIAEPEIVRHYNRLSKKNFDLDTGFYPLRSCTMKHNPKPTKPVAAPPVHDEAQPEAQRARGRPAGSLAPAPAPGSGVRAGRARADVEPPARP